MAEKLTPEEIKKALECCTPENESCLNCPLIDVSVPKCAGILYKATIDLINRQQAEIKRLREIRDLCNTTILEKNEQIRKLEISDSSKEECTIRQHGEIKELKAEIERLKAFKSYFDEIYGKGLDVANWHENGEQEPFDNFYEDAVKEMVGEQG